MNHESGPSSSSLGSERPDKPLAVKCEYNSYHQKLTFKSARFCTYDGLKEKIEERFDLAARPFTIQWKDDYGESNFIDNEITLNEAIDYYHSGDESSVTSSGSVFLSRSSSRHHKITMHVQICIDYDGPSLSDTASLASREDPFEGSQVSFSAGELSSSPQDDDAVTVSSKDSCGLPRQGRGDSSLIKKLLNGTSRADCSSSQTRLLPKPSRSRILSFGSRVSSREDEATESGTRDTRTNAPNSDSLADTEKAYADDPSAVLARLRLEDQQGPSLPHQRSMLMTDIGQAWLKDQSTNRMKATLGGVPAPSISDDFSLNTDTPLSYGDPNDILLEKDERGKYFYTYTGSRSSESAGDLDYEVVNFGHPINGTGIPHDLLVPEEVSDCSECGRILDQVKYICTTCGEKTPTSRTALAAAAAGEGKGKNRTSPDYHHHEYPSEYESQEPSYPPRAHRNPAMPYSFANSPNASVYSSSSKPLPALPSTSPTQTIFGRSLGSQSTLVPQSSFGSSSSLTRTGYELCDMCFGKVGLDHSMSGGVESPTSPTFPRTPQEISIARRSAPKQRGQLRHAFLEQMWGFNGWQDIEQDEMSHRCSGCQSMLSGTRYKCISDKCDNLTICRGCYSDVHNIHPVHPFLEMRVKPVSRSPNFQAPSNDGGTYESTDEPSLKHPGVRCFNCQQDIVGARFRCVDCTTIDMDICSNCETAGLPGNLNASDGGHNSSHIMLKIPVPLDMHEVQHVSQRAHGLRHGRDRADLRGLSPLMRSSPGSVSSISAGTVSYGDGGPADIEEDYVHLQVCNSCAEPIVGIRYQCLNCPSKPNSYNLCSDCESKSYRVHDPMHTFLKIPRPVDIPGPLESEFPIIPVLYRDPAGPAPGSPSAEISGDPAVYLQDLTHAFAFCDRHMKRIVGKWFRCAFCPKDLCADCEVLDTHDNTHVFLVFKAPVDMQAFRHFADLENQPGVHPCCAEAFTTHDTSNATLKSHFAFYRCDCSCPFVPAIFPVFLSHGQSNVLYWYYKGKI
ncbi:hypothetical protein BJV78DRAFT_407146 [Lactifluus subvellereus]|nr:hypothetical protein BJV78DRAFT_407146 [Lactifluus subvellereus]